MNRIIFRLLCVSLCVAIIALFAHGSARAEIASKSYVDSLAAAGGGTIGGGSVPSWAALNSADWASSHWGDTWEVVSADGAYKVEGVAACLSTDTKSGNAPSASTYGLNCWCRVSRVNDEHVQGAWVFNRPYSTDTVCYSNCAFNCGNCVRLGDIEDCSRAALFAAP
ncbi:MAG: hypothetical protein LBJ73_02910 [Rickettsiales bacterium]|nr:hypothetical protein [Rickettsiales bacterium]